MIISFYLIIFKLNNIINNNFYIMKLINIYTLSEFIPPFKIGSIILNIVLSLGIFSNFLNCSSIIIVYFSASPRFINSSNTSDNTCLWIILSEFW